MEAVRLFETAVTIYRFLEEQEDLNLQQIAVRRSDLAHSHIIHSYLSLHNVRVPRVNPLKTNLICVI